MEEVSQQELDAKCGITYQGIMDSINLAIVEAKDAAKTHWLKKILTEVSAELESRRIAYLEEKHTEANKRMKVFSHEGFYNWRIAIDSEEREGLTQKIRLKLFVDGIIPKQKDIHTNASEPVAFHIKHAIRPMLENYFVCEVIRTLIWQEENKAVLLGIKKLDRTSLSKTNDLFYYYTEKWEFQVINNAYGAFKNIPIPLRASEFIAENYTNYPWNSYIKGFIEEYKKPIEIDSSTEEAQKWSIRHISTTQGNAGSIPRPEFTEKIEEYGAEIAKAFKAWEYVIKNLPFYEELYAKENEKDKTQAQPYITNESTIDTLRTTLLNHAWPEECETELESIEVWRTRFINSEDKIDPFFPEHLPTGRKGSPFTNARLFIKAMLDVIVEATDSKPTNKDRYSKARWGFELTKMKKDKTESNYNKYKQKIEAILNK